MSAFPPCYYCLNTAGCDRKLCKNNGHASVLVRIISYPYLFPSLLSIHCTRRYQWSTKYVCTQPAPTSLEAWMMLKHRAGFHHRSLKDRFETFQAAVWRYYYYWVTQDIVWRSGRHFITFSNLRYNRNHGSGLYVMGYVTPLLMLWPQLCVWLSMNIVLVNKMGKHLRLCFIGLHMTEKEIPQLINWTYKCL